MPEWWNLKTQIVDASRIVAVRRIGVGHLDYAVTFAGAELHFSEAEMEHLVTKLAEKQMLPIDGDKKRPNGKPNP